MADGLAGTCAIATIERQLCLREQHGDMLNVKPAVRPESERLAEVRLGGGKVSGEYPLDRHREREQVRHHEVIAAGTPLRLPVADADRQLVRTSAVRKRPCNHRPR